MRLISISLLSSFLRIFISHAVFLSVFLTVLDSAHKNCVNGASVTSDLDTELDSGSELDFDLKSIIENLNLKTQENVFYPRIRDSRDESVKVEVGRGEKGSKNFKSTDGSGVLFPTATTTSGVVRGKVDKSRKGIDYYSFEGIPYGTSERFQPSVLYTETWEGIRDARTPGSPCMQLAAGKAIGSEDCLYLNVHKPHEDYFPGKRPVIVYIHGGSFNNGDGGSYPPKYFIDEGIVFVTINYRLGALGYLCSEDKVITGNFGLYDCITALHWVQLNIENFGGDPDKVTIMGLSAGSSTVSHLIVSPLAAGLFHRAISQSGTCLNPWSAARSPKATAVSLAQKLGCPVEKTQEMADCLKGTSAEDIVLKQPGFTDMDMAAMTIKVLPLAPVVQKWEDEATGFQTKDPRERYQSGDYHKVPYIAGFTRDEGISMMGGQIMSDPLLQMLMNMQWSTHCPNLLMLEDKGFTPQQTAGICTAVWQYYLGDDTIREGTREKVINMCSDLGFNWGTFETLKWHSQFADAYGYMLSYRGGRSMAEMYGYETPQCTHGDDVPMTIAISGYEEEGLNDDYQRVGTEQCEFSKELVRLFSRFAYTGTPEGAEPAWDKIQFGNPVNDKWYELNRPNRVVYKLLDERMSFWDSLQIHDQPPPSS